MARVSAARWFATARFYFANFEQRALNQSGLITIAPPTWPRSTRRLDAVGYPGARIATGLFPNPVHNTNFLGKVDHQFGDSDQFSIRYSLYDVNSNNSRGAGGLERGQRIRRTWTIPTRPSRSATSRRFRRARSTRRAGSSRAAT